MICRYNLAFSCKNSKFPVSKFIELTLVNNKQSLQKFVDSEIMKIDSDDNIVFEKISSKNTMKKGTILRERLVHIDNSLDAKSESNLLGKSLLDDISKFDDLNFAIEKLSL